MKSGARRQEEQARSETGKGRQEKDEGSGSKRGDEERIRVRAWWEEDRGGRRKKGERH